MRSSVRCSTKLLAFGELIYDQVEGTSIAKPATNPHLFRTTGSPFRTTGSFFGFADPIISNFLANSQLSNGDEVFILENCDSASLSPYL
jgi:hypothetical protein